MNDKLPKTTLSLDSTGLQVASDHPGVKAAQCRASAVPDLRAVADVGLSRLELTRRDPVMTQFRFPFLLAVWISGNVCAAEALAQPAAVQPALTTAKSASATSGAASAGLPSDVGKKTVPTSSTTGTTAPRSGVLAFTAHWSTPAEAARNVDELLPDMEQIRIASQHNFIPSRGPLRLLVFKPFAEKDVTEANGDRTERLTYRALIIDSSSGAETASKLISEASFKQAIVPSAIWSERATRGTSDAPGTDFKKDELPIDGKTLLHLDTNIASSSWHPWKRARVFVIGGAGSGGEFPRVVGSFETVISNKNSAIAISLLACLLAYIAAACATYFVHKAQRMYKENGSPPVLTPLPLGAHQPAPTVPTPTPRWFDSLRSTFKNSQAKQDHGHGPLTGTNYATFWAHLNPVVLSAGGNGIGSATNLQILFFSLVVFGVVSYIWLLTGQLTGLSYTVLLLMGISGLGATAAAGAELTKNRLSFDNWAWLIIRGWLPPGGVAEVNIAKWKDIFTTGGAFDVYRFQMICFSVVVGIALIGAGTQLNDLSSFSVPEALLGILGLSQVVYVAGKLVAPPSISDLDTQITELQAAEKTLRDVIDLTAPNFPSANVVNWSTDDKLGAAKVAYSDYLAIWQKTKTMFETTLGRLIPELAVEKRPPFDLPDVVLNRLPTAKAGVDHQQHLSLLGYPGTGPFTWTLDSGSYPKDMKLSIAANKIDAELSFLAADAIQGSYRFVVRVAEVTSNQTRSKEFILTIRP